MLDLGNTINIFMNRFSLIREQILPSASYLLFV